MNLGLCVLIDYIFRRSLFLCVFSNLIMKVQTAFSSFSLMSADTVRRCRRMSPLYRASRGLLSGLRRDKMKAQKESWVQTSMVIQLVTLTLAPGLLLVSALATYKCHIFWGSFEKKKLHCYAHPPLCHQVLQTLPG